MQVRACCRQHSTVGEADTSSPVEVGKAPMSAEYTGGGVGTTATTGGVVVPAEASAVGAEAGMLQGRQLKAAGPRSSVGRENRLVEADFGR